MVAPASRSHEAKRGTGRVHLASSLRIAQPRRRAVLPTNPTAHAPHREAPHRRSRVGGRHRGHVWRTLDRHPVAGRQRGGRTQPDHHRDARRDPLGRARIPVLGRVPVALADGRRRPVRTSPVRRGGNGAGHRADVVPDTTSTLIAGVAGEGTHHAWVVAFSSDPADHRLYHLRSADAVEWRLDPAETVDVRGVEFSPPGPFPSSVFRDDGRWVMYLSGIEAPARSGFDLWRATARDPSGPWTVDPEPVLARGGGRSWDSQAVDFPAVFPTDDGYGMLYQGSTGAQPTAGWIGLATSRGRDDVDEARRPVDHRSRACRERSRGRPRAVRRPRRASGAAAPPVPRG